MKKITFYVQVVSLLLVAGFIAGCASTSYGTKMDQDKVSQIKKGVTTKAEVEALLGLPASISMIGDGRRMMSYTFTDTLVQQNAASYIPIAGLFLGKAEGKTRTQNLQIIITKSGVVEDYEFSDSTRNMEHSLIGGTKVTSEQEKK